MPQFDYEVIRTIRVARDITVRAKDEDAAQEKIEAIIAAGSHGLDKIVLACPKEWDATEDDTDYQLR